MNSIVVQKVTPLRPKSLPIADARERIGGRLAQARQAKGLTEIAVATKLRLNVAIIQALEQDQYDKMPSTVFVRGYIKKYARFLDLDENELPVFPDASPRELIPPTVPMGGADREISSNHALVQIVTWSIVIVLITLIGLWWQGQLAWEDKSVESITAKPTMEPDIGMPSNLLKKPTYSAPLPLPAPPKPATNSTPQSPAKSQVPVLKPPVQVTPTPTVVPSPPATIIQEEQNIAAVTTTGKTAIPIVSPTPQKPDTIKLALPKTVPQHQIILEFLGSSWVNIHDSKHKFKLVGRMHKGDKRTLNGGTPPYKMILGNSSKITVTVDGKSIDIAPHSRGGVARFDLNPSSAPGQ